MKVALIACSMLVLVQSAFAAQGSAKVGQPQIVCRGTHGELGQIAIGLSADWTDATQTDTYVSAEIRDSKTGAVLGSFSPLMVGQGAYHNTTFMHVSKKDGREGIDFFLNIWSNLQAEFRFTTDGTQMIRETHPAYDGFSCEQL